MFELFRCIYSPHQDCFYHFNFNTLSSSLHRLTVRHVRLVFHLVFLVFLILVERQRQLSNAAHLYPVEFDHLWDACSSSAAHISFPLSALPCGLLQLCFYKCFFYLAVTSIISRSRFLLRHNLVINWTELNTAELSELPLHHIYVYLFIYLYFSPSMFVLCHNLCVYSVKQVTSYCAPEIHFLLLLLHWTHQVWPRLEQFKMDICEFVNKSHEIPAAARGYNRMNNK